MFRGVRYLHKRAIAKTWPKMEQETAEQLLTQGLHHGAQYRYEKANALLMKSLRMLQRHEKPNCEQLRHAYNGLGILQFTKGCWPKAREHLDKALIVSGSLSRYPKGGIGGLLNDCAVVLMKQGKLNMAENQLNRAKQMSECAHRPDVLLLTATHANLGELYTQKGDLAKAESCLRTATTWLSKMNKEDQTFTVSSAVVHGNLGRVCLFRRSYGEARHLLEHAAQVSMEIERHPCHAKCLSNLALLHLYRQNTCTAAKLLRSARIGFRDSVGNKHMDMIICLNNLAAVSSLREATVLYKRCAQKLSRFNQEDDRVKTCLEAVVKNTSILEQVCQNTDSDPFVPENLVEALQIGYGIEGRHRLQLLSHCNHIMGVGMPSQ